MRILVVEDEHRIAQSIRKGLEQEHFAVDLAHSGTEGYDLATTEEYDALIIDRMLPGMDGAELCAQLRKQQIHAPILMLTAKGQIRDKVSGLDAGADDYMTKPFSFEELLARLRALSRRPQQLLETILQVADLKLDATAYAVTRGTTPIKLSGKEFALLEYMMRNSGRILNKDQIIAHVWNYDADILPNTIEVYIRNLRNKIDNPFPHRPPVIHTVRGFGYRLGT